MDNENEQVDDEMEVLKDKLVQVSKSSQAEILELRTKLEEETKRRDEVETMLRKAQLGRKEVQKLRSTLGEVQSSSEGYRERVNRLESENEALKEKLNLLENWSTIALGNAFEEALKWKYQALVQARMKEKEVFGKQIKGLRILLANMPLAKSIKDTLRVYLENCEAHTAALTSYLAECSDDLERNLQRLQGGEHVSVEHAFKHFSFEAPGLPNQILDSVLPITAEIIQNFTTDTDLSECSSNLRSSARNVSPHESRQISKANPTSRVDLEECPICFESFKNTEVCTLANCNHTFHRECVMNWMQEKNNCPLCRKILLLQKSFEYHSIQLDDDLYNDV